MAATAGADDVETIVATLAKIGSASQPVFSPDGKRIAFISTISGSPQVWMLPTAGGWPDQITALDDPVTAIDWSPNGEWIALQSAPGGGLNEQVYIMRPDGSGMRRITEGGKTNNRLGWWMPDSKSLLIGSSRRSAAAIDIWIFPERPVPSLYLLPLLMASLWLRPLWVAGVGLLGMALDAFSPPF